MSEIQEIEVLIAADGSVRIEVHGVKGSGCRALTEEVERLMGGDVVTRHPTPEYDEITVAESDRLRLQQES